MTCAFEPCGFSCPLPGGCVRRRFPDQVAAVNPLKPASDLRDDAKALNGTKAREVRDPRFIKRNRKALTRG